MVAKRDAELISALKGNPSIAKDLKISAYKLQKIWTTSQSEMKEFIKKTAPILIEKGYFFLEMDHKHVNSSMANYQNKLFGVLALIKFGHKSASYPLALTPSNSSACDEAIEITRTVLHVSFLTIILFYNFEGLHQ